MNLSLTELILSVTGHPLLTFNSFAGEWSFGPTVCQINAFSMTYLGAFASCCQLVPTVNIFIRLPVSGIQSIVTLSVLALQRYMMVTRLVDSQ